MENKGKLKIFFGYSAGVGKTYSMLKTARELLSDGVDVVLGYLEPHDRVETIKMAEGFETTSLKEFSYRGISLKEFDVDVAIKRRPQILLVDELAHTNVPGSKNRKRYLDVEEILNSGINVWTTVNVQHIEGLHDLVDTATGVDVSERVPDEIFDYADEVILIDIEPNELIERMQEGKIYKKNRAATALENFFKTDNLSSLRELFMRRGADRIEKQAHSGELKTKVLVLISPSPSSQKNIRVAARTAEAYHCKFSAMYVETQGSLTDDAAAELKKHMSLVRDMGGELIVKYSEDVVDTVVNFVKLSGVTNLIIGKTWQSVGKKVGLEDKFISCLPSIEVLIVPDSRGFNPHKKRFREFFAMAFGKKKLLHKYNATNKILDIINLLMSAKNDNKTSLAVCEILSRAFERSCKITFDSGAQYVPYLDEDISFFNSEKELAVLDWCMKNVKPAGRGTDTLRESGAIYFPVSLRNSTCVVGFSCLNTKMTLTEKLIFRQIENVLKFVLLK